MRQTPIQNPPIRITDLIELKRKGATVKCFPFFRIVPVDFAHRASRYEALVFMCRFSGIVDNLQYTFRKFYARGCMRDECPNVFQTFSIANRYLRYMFRKCFVPGKAYDECPDVSRAVSIANRYLQRDYYRLKQAGIEIDNKLFTLGESIVLLLDIKEEATVIDSYLQMAKEGSKVFADVTPEYVPATEHFEYQKNPQTYLVAGITVTTPAETAQCQRCLGCYGSEREREERPVQIQVANDRLSLLYTEFDLSSVKYEKTFFV